MELKTRWNNCDIYLHQGDITLLDVDAVVNAANSGLRGGGGVDGAIHRRGGPAIMAECQKIIAKIASLPTGDAVITTGGKLAARHVIHTVGPVYHAGSKEAPALLASCYRTSLAVARDNGLRSVAFSCISTGIYGYPSAEACEIAVKTVKEELEGHDAIGKVIFCTFGAEDYELYRAALTK